jgi:hypothetical protein
MNSLKSRSKLAKASLAALTVSLTLVFVPAASAFDLWGAIAVDPDTGATGTSFEFSSARSAKIQAVAVCEIRGNGCQAIVWVSDGVAALVKNRNNGRYYGGFGETRAEAAASARKNARDKKAVLIRTVFSGEFDE